MKRNKLTENAKKARKQKQISTNSISLCGSTTVDPPTEILKAARAAQQRSVEQFKRLPRELRKKGKTIASNGIKTMSGYKPDEIMPEGVLRPEETQVKAMYE